MTAPTFANSYVVTNRTADGSGFGATPLPTGELTFCSAPVPPSSSGGTVNYVANSADYSVHTNDPASTIPADYAALLVNDLSKTLDANGTAYLTVFIHGLDTDWPGSVADFALCGMALQGVNVVGGALLGQGADGGSCSSVSLDAPYQGLVVGFSWPCVGSGFTVALDLHTTRENAKLGEQSLSNLLVALSGLWTNIKNCTSLKLSVVAHSEGCYTTQEALGYLSSSGQKPFLDQVVLLAADLDTTALSIDRDRNPCGEGMPAVASGVTAYWSTHDDVLWLDGNLFGPGATLFWGACVRNSTLERLGKVGPPEGMTLYAGCTSLNCSEVVTADRTCVSKPPPSILPLPSRSTHVAYFYMPLVLNDLVQVLNGSTLTGRSMDPSKIQGFWTLNL